MDPDRRTLLKQYITQLQQGEEMARAAAAQELGKLRDRHATEVLVAAMEDDDEAPLVRRYATAALGDLQDVYAVGPLTSALDDPALAWHAEQALRRIGTPSALQAVSAKLAAR